MAGPVNATLQVSAQEFVRLACQAAEIDPQRVRVVDGDLEIRDLNEAEEDRLAAAYRDVMARFMAERRRTHGGTT